MRLIDADALKEDHGMADDCPLCKQKVRSCQYDTIYTKMDFCGWIDDAPTIEPERKKDIIQKFHDYQIDWLKSHYDIELEPQLEEMIVRFLHDTANCYMMEIDREEGEQE